MHDAPLFLGLTRPPKIFGLPIGYFVSLMLGSVIPFVGANDWRFLLIGVLSFVVVTMLGTGLMAMVPTIAQSLAQTATGLGGVAGSTFRTGGSMAAYGRSGAAGMIGAGRGAAGLDAGGRRPSDARLNGNTTGQIGRSAVQTAMRLASRTPDKS